MKKQCGGVYFGTLIGEISVRQILAYINESKNYINKIFFGFIFHMDKFSANTNLGKFGVYYFPRV